MFQRDKLNSFLLHTLDLWEMLPDINPTRSFWMNVVNTYLSTAVSFFRYEVQIGSFTPVPINYYSLSLLPSGAFKDATVNFISRRLFGEIDRYSKTIISEMARRHNSKLESRLLEIYGKKNRELNMEYKALQIPQHIEQIITSATSEGFCQRVLDISKLDFGSTLHRHGEFLDYYLSKSRDSQDILSLTKDMFYGHLRVTALKGDKSLMNIDGVPHNVLYYTSSSRLEDADNLAKFKNELSTGLLRRCHFCTPVPEDEKVLETLSLSERTSREKGVDDLSSRLTKIITEAFIRGHKFCSSNADYERTVVLSESAYEVFNEYINKINEEIQQNPEHAGIINTKKEKVIKLASVYSLIESDFINSRAIPSKYVEQAIHFVDESHRYTEAFLELKLNNRMADKLYSLLCSKGNIDEGLISRYEWGKNYLSLRNIIKTEILAVKKNDESIVFSEGRVVLLPGANSAPLSAQVMHFVDKRKYAEAKILTQEVTTGYVSPFITEGFLANGEAKEALNTVVMHCKNILQASDISSAFGDVNHIVISDEKNHYVCFCLEPKARLTLQIYEQIEERLRAFFPLFTTDYHGEVINLSNKEILHHDANCAFSAGFIGNSSNHLLRVQFGKTKKTKAFLDEIDDIINQKAIIPENFLHINAEYYKERVTK